jgi:hypothetical protein
MEDNQVIISKSPKKHNRKAKDRKSKNWRMTTKMREKATGTSDTVSDAYPSTGKQSNIK